MATKVSLGASAKKRQLIKFIVGIVVLAIAISSLGAFWYIRQSSRVKEARRQCEEQVAQVSKARKSYEKLVNNQLLINLSHQDNDDSKKLSEMLEEKSPSIVACNANSIEDLGSRNAEALAALQWYSNKSTDIRALAVSLVKEMNDKQDQNKDNSQEEQKKEDSNKSNKQDSKKPDKQTKTNKNKPNKRKTKQEEQKSKTKQTHKQENKGNKGGSQDPAKQKKPETPKTPDPTKPKKPETPKDPEPAKPKKPETPKDPAKPAPPVQPAPPAPTPEPAKPKKPVDPPQPDPKVPPAKSKTK